MNANKKNSGWILRPSKSFPGKFYYFNVLNGDTAWSLEDTEKKDGYSPQVLDIHDHPEPLSPPPADTQPKYSLTRSPFGQSATKTLQSTPEELNVIWTPIQIQVPIVITPKSRTPQVSEPRMDMVKVPPQFDVEKRQYNMDKARVQPQCNMDKLKMQPQPKKLILEPCKELFVHALPKPLCQRFLNYEAPVISFNKENKINKVHTSTPIKITPNPTFKNIASNTDLSFENLEKSQDFEVPSIPKYFEKNKLRFESLEKSQDLCEVPSIPKDFEEDKLEECELKGSSDKADLRLVIQAKKRKGLNLEVNTNTEKIESKKIKTVRQELPSKPKKRVTFEMDFESSSAIIDNEYEDEDMNFKDKYAITIQNLKSLARNDSRDDYWYIVVDTEVLLEEFGFLEDFVKIDPSCKLLIPRPVIDEISALSRGDCRGRTRVTQARHVMRKVPGPHVVVPSANNEEIQSPLNDAILKSCVDAMDKKFHLILISNDEQLLRTARCYPIHCYNIKYIKTGLASESSTQFAQTGTAVKNFRSNLFEDFNDKDKEMINIFKKNGVESRSLIEKTVNSKENSIISTQNSRISENSMFMNKTSLFSNDCSRISNQNSMGTNSRILNSNEDTISLEHSTIANTTKSWISNVDSTNFTKPLSAEWRTSNGHENSTIFGKPTLQFAKENANSKFERGTVKSIYETNEVKEPQCFETGKNSRSIFEFVKEKKSNQSNKTKEVLNFEMRKENAHSKFETDVFKKPQCTALKKNNSMVNLTKFYVKSKVMENRLKERSDEFMCFFTQIMEDTLAGVLEKLSPSVLKAMPPPWSLFEALQSVKTIYKDHSLVRSIVQELCMALYEKDVRGMDKIKKNVNPNEYMKALGCGIHLIQYLKNILPHPEELSTTEESLLDLLKTIEDPTNDNIEHLVKLPALPSYDDMEVKHNFVKNSSDIVDYLKKHYPQWQNYDNNCNTKIVRTYGRDLNLLKLDKKVTVGSDYNGATRNVDFTTRNFDYTTRNADVATRNADGASRNVDFTTRNAGVATRNVDLTTRNAGVATRNVDFTTRNAGVANRNADNPTRNVITTRNADNAMRNIEFATRNGNVATRNVGFKTNNVVNALNDTESLKRVKITMNLGNEKNYNETEPLKMKQNHLVKTKYIQNETEKIPELSTLRSIKNKIDFEKNQSKRMIENRTNGPKIVRNMQILEKFENMLKRKQLEEQSFDDDITHYSTNDCKFNNHTNNSKENNSKQLKKYEDKSIEGTNSKSQRKSDDSTNDSGIGNESPEIYSVVTKFSSKLSGSLEKIRAFIDGTFQEFNSGRLRNKTKKIFRLKAFETNFMITKIIAGLNKVIRSKNGRSKITDKKHSSSEQLGKNKEVILRCIKLAQMLQKTLNIILSVPNEEELNSSLSLNASS